MKENAPEREKKTQVIDMGKILYIVDEALKDKLSAWGAFVIRELKDLEGKTLWQIAIDDSLLHKLSDEDFSKVFSKKNFTLIF